MNITLSPDLERLIAEKVESGEYRSADEVIREGLELLSAKDSLKGQEREEAHSLDLAELFERIAKEIPEEEWDKIPTDLAQNLDHYLYGSAKSE